MTLDRTAGTSTRAHTDAKGHTMVSVTRLRLACGGATFERDRRRLNWLRAGVLGANDGIVSTAGLVVGVAAATPETGPILTAASPACGRRGLDGVG